MRFSLSLIAVISFCIIVALVTNWANPDTPRYTTVPLAAAPLKPTATPPPPLPRATTTPAVVATSTTADTPPRPATVTYVHITSGCAITVDVTCATAHSAPSTDSPVRARLRTNTLLLLNSSTTTADGTIWYEISFDEHLRYPDRVTVPWYINAEAGTLLTAPAPADLSATTPPTAKRIVVDRSDQTLRTYQGDTLLQTYQISTGLSTTPTPRGTFRVYRMTPTRYMQGPIPGISTKQYDLPGVPWNLYFTKEGAVIHGAYWHNSFGQPYSNGCVNLRPADARTVFLWADLGTAVVVQD